MKCFLLLALVVVIAVQIVSTERIVCPPLTDDPKPVFKCVDKEVPAHKNIIDAYKSCTKDGKTCIYCVYKTVGMINKNNKADMNKASDFLLAVIPDYAEAIMTATAECFGIDTPILVDDFPKGFKCIAAAIEKVCKVKTCDGLTVQTA